MVRKLSKCMLLLAAGAWLAAPATALGQQRTVELDPAQTRIEFTLGASLHTVHGSFQLKSGSVRFDAASGKASGMVIADARSAETGNKARDRKMHSQVLESQSYPEITFSPSKISGAVSLQSTSTAQLEGTFRLHGDDHVLVLTVPVKISGNTVSGNTRFTIPYVAWGLKNPSTFFLHVSDKVQVEVTFVGRLSE